MTSLNKFLFAAGVSRTMIGEEGKDEKSFSSYFTVCISQSVKVSDLIVKAKAGENVRC